jgi:hypothetical protein
LFCSFKRFPLEIKINLNLEKEKENKKSKKSKAPAFEPPKQKTEQVQPEISK